MIYEKQENNIDKRLSPVRMNAHTYNHIWLGALVLVSVFLLEGCSDPSTITLRIGAGHPVGPTVYVNEMRDFFVPEVTRRVEEETDHEINFVQGYGGSIAQVAEVLEAVQAGILDIGAYCVCFEPAKLFLHNFSYYVPFGLQDAVEVMALTRGVYDLNPWLEEQFGVYSQRLLAINGWDSYHLGTVEPWETVEDLNGVKIGGAGPNLPWLKYAGVIPVQSALPDGYLSMQTGVYSGWLMFPSSYYGYKFHEPAPYYTLIGFGAMGGAVALTMNNRSFERLPLEVQQIILEVAREYELHAAKALNEGQEIALQALRDAGAHIRELPSEVRADWANSLVEFPNAMAQDANSRGMPGSEIIRSYIEEIDRSGYNWPVKYIID